MNSCHDIPEDSRILQKTNKILLMGNPNVGKSVFFTELTGIHAISSNYTGTTVNFMEGSFKIDTEEYTLIDVPGTYSLTPTNQAEAVAARFIESGARAIICVLDASNLERNLSLALEIKQSSVPIIFALNLIDVAERHGININAKLLAEELGAPVIPTIAVKKQGIDELTKQLETLLKSSSGLRRASVPLVALITPTPHSIWDTAKTINRRVTSKNPAKPGFLDRLGNAMLKPMPGIPLAILVMLLTISVVVGGGEVLREGLLHPLVDNVIVPFFRDRKSVV